MKERLFVCLFVVCYKLQITLLNCSLKKHHFIWFVYSEWDRYQWVNKSPDEVQHVSMRHLISGVLTKLFSVTYNWFYWIEKTTHNTFYCNNREWHSSDSVVNSENRVQLFFTRAKTQRRLCVCLWGWGVAVHMGLQRTHVFKQFERQERKERHKFLFFKNSTAVSLKRFRTYDSGDRKGSWEENRRKLVQWE